MTSDWSEDDLCKLILWCRELQEGARLTAASARGNGMAMVATMAMTLWEAAGKLGDAAELEYLRRPCRSTPGSAPSA
jgi:hypothetical protein